MAGYLLHFLLSYNPVLCNVGQDAKINYQK